ncbi:MAG: hypothetical protein ACYCQJ_15890, partial [Nitrososphaerales archaeon]
YPTLSPHTRLQEKEISKSRLWDREAGLNYLEMMYLSYGRLILTSCLPLRGLTQEKSFEEKGLY